MAFLHTVMDEFVFVNLPAGTMPQVWCEKYGAADNTKVCFVDRNMRTQGEIDQKT